MSKDAGRKNDEAPTVRESHGMGWMFPMGGSMFTLHLDGGFFMGKLG